MPPFLPGALARNLRDGRITERQKLFYPVLLFVLQLLARWANGANERSVVTTAIFTIIVLIGILVAFGTNSRGDNRNFLERWLCLHTILGVWVVYVPLFLYYGAYLALYRTYGLFIVRTFQRFGWASLGFNCILIILQYALLNHFIRIASSGTPSIEEKPFAPIAAP